MGRITGTIFALDLGVSCGFAHGCPGGEVVSGSVRLKRPDERIDVAFANLIAFLANQFEALRPAFVIKERMLALEAYKAIGNAEKTVRAHAGYHAIVEGMCRRFEVDWSDVSDSTARKHFIGKGNKGSRGDTKKAVVLRCHALRLMPRDCLDEDQADAICIHDWACANFGGRAASFDNFQLYGQGEG